MLIEKLRPTRVLKATFLASGPSSSHAFGVEQVAEDLEFLKLPRLVQLSSGELLDFAVQKYGSGVQFGVRELARMTGKDVHTILSRNRTLAHSSITRNT